MKRVIMNNLGLKIGSVILAIVTWFLVVNASNPVRTQIFSNVPITVINSAYVESMGLSYQLGEQTQVRVSVKANTNILENISPTDIVVTADLTQIINMESDPVMVPLSVTCAKYPNLNADAITAQPGNVAISLEHLTSEDFVVTASAGETKPDKEYEVGVLQAEPERITISGPESIINKIDIVVAQVDVSDLTQDGTLSGRLTVIDKNQDALSEYQMNYLTLSDVSDGNVNVHVQLWRLQTDVQIEAEASGTPMRGYQISEVDTTPNTITVVGSDVALKQLRDNGNVITIPSEEIDASGKDEDFETKIDISEYLPDDIRLATDVSSSVLVTTTILPNGSQAFDMASANIASSGLPTGLNAVFATDRIQIRVQGSDAMLNGINGSSFTGTVDLSNCTEAGTYTLPVNVTLPDGVELLSEVSVTVTVTDIGTEKTQADSARAE